MKILLLDIETCPALGYFWKMFDENIGLNQLLVPTEMLCWAARWHGEKKVHYAHGRNGKHKMLAPLWDLLNEADAVVHYNGKRFDIPHINREFINLGLRPPSPYKEIDLLTVMRRKFKLMSNRLEYVAHYFDLPHPKGKVDFTLWKDYMDGKSKAYAEMKEYNVGDVETLTALYDKVLPWIQNHPNHGLYGDKTDVCPQCGGSKYQHRGVARSKALVYMRLHCNDCGSWFRSRKAIPNDLKFKGE